MKPFVEDPNGGLSSPSYARESEPLWSESEGQIAYAGTYLLCLIFFWVIVPAFYALYLFLRTLCHGYTLTDQRLRESTGILVRQTEELELYRVKDIKVVQPLLQRLLGCGSVILLTSDRSTPQVVLSAIRNPHAVADILRDCVERCRVLKGVREID